jgi:zinc and cadmium transporter
MYAIGSFIFLHMWLPLLFLTLISASGLILFARKNISTTLLNLLIALGAGSMLAVSLVHIFPEAIEHTEDAVFAFLGGFLAIYLIEELMTRHKHDHSHGDHAHEDPHEHYDHIALISWLAICTHTLLDGVGIRASLWLSESAGYAVLFGVAIHQIPVSLALASLLRESALTWKKQVSLILFFALMAPIGFLLSDMILTDVSEMMVWLAAAFAGGSLLYIATADLLPVIHSTSKYKYLSISSFLAWVIIMSLFATHSHEEGHRDHEEIAPTKEQWEIIR